MSDEIVNQSESFNESYGNDSVLGYENTQKELFSPAFQIIIYIIYNIVFVAALVGNILVCYVVFSSPRMRTVTNYLIANLAIGDLLMALLCVPFSYISILLQYWPFGELLCHIVSPAQAVCVFVSAYTLVALAVDRYMAILYPLKPRLRRSQAVIVILVVWVIATLTSLPVAIFTKIETNNSTGNPECREDWPEDGNGNFVYSFTVMILQYFIPIKVLIFTYTRIAIAVWGKKAPGEAENGRDQRLAKSKRKTVIMTLVVVIGYTFAWLPLNTLQLLAQFKISDQWDDVAYLHIILICHWLAMAHTTYNPLIYGWINPRFRAAFKQVFSKFTCTLCKLKGGQNGGNSRAYNRRNKRQSTRTTSLAYSTTTKSRQSTIEHKRAQSLKNMNEKRESRVLTGSIRNNFVMNGEVGKIENGLQLSQLNGKSEGGAKEVGKIVYSWEAKNKFNGSCPSGVGPIKECSGEKKKKSASFSNSSENKTSRDKFMKSSKIKSLNYKKYEGKRARPLNRQNSESNTDSD